MVYKRRCYVSTSTFAFATSLVCASCANADVARERADRTASSEAALSEVQAGAAAKPAHGDKAIIFVWDGLRPDSVTPEHTPNLARLRDQSGVNFTDNHSVFPTFTMMNASAFATGAYPGAHGFYGNTEYQPGPKGKNASAQDVNFSQPVFTEDYGILHALDGFYGDMEGSGLFLVDTLFQRAHAAGLKTAAVGKSGPAFMQDHRGDGSLGVILDENIAFPHGFAQDLQQAGFALPSNTTFYPYPEGAITLAADNGNPTGATSANTVLLSDKTTSDPRAALGSPHNARNEYMMKVYLEYVLPKLNPDLSLIWFRNPDSTEHTFGPGSANYLDALKDQDMLLGKLLDQLDQLGLADHTNVIVVSDHGHSTVAGDPALFPLRGLSGAADGTGAVADVDAHGYSVSGDIRSADLLTRAGFAHVYDGGGCVLDPVMSGIKADGSAVYPTQTDADGSVCGTMGAKYNTGRFLVPAELPNDAVVIAANGGSDYLYVPSHDADIVERLVSALQERKAYGPIFVRSQFGDIAGTLPLTTIHVEGPDRSSPPTPDIVVSFDWDDTATTAASLDTPGTEYESAQNNRGMHGSFSPIDVHNTLIAAGPDFKSGYRDHYPSGNVDVAPTVAHLLGLDMPEANGRVLHEALAQRRANYSVQEDQQIASAALQKACEPSDPDCSTPSSETHYEMTLYMKTLSLGDGKPSYVYFDKAKATRTVAKPRHRRGRNQ